MPTKTAEPDFADAPWSVDTAPALCIGESCWSYAELQQLVAERVQTLRRLGLGDDTKQIANLNPVVVCKARPGLDLLLMQHALARMGAALLPVRPDLDAAAVQALIRQTGAEWRWLPGTGVDGLLPTSQAALDNAASGMLTNATSDRLALLIQTSGSSGAAKAVMLTTRAVLASCALINSVLTLGSNDEWLCCLPLQHVSGLAIGYRCALAGATMRLQTGLAGGFDLAAVATDLARGRVTHLSLVPPMLERLLHAGIEPPPSLRVLLLGGQALHSSLARGAVEAGWPLYITYGMSETFSQVATAAYTLTHEPSTRIGPPLPGVELDCPRCTSSPRALRLRGPMLMAGYANPARRPGDGLCDGWLETADLACLDVDGALHVQGRADDVLVIGGMNILPALVEERLARAPGVHSVAVVGLSHPIWGQTLAACYTGDSARSDIDAWCRRHLPSAERPRIFVHCADLPLLASGKLDRGALLELASRHAS